MQKFLKLVINFFCNFIWFLSRGQTEELLLLSVILENILPPLSQM